MSDYLSSDDPGDTAQSWRGFLAPDGARFIEALSNAALFVAGRDEQHSRPALRNVHWHYKDGSLTIVATDAYQLSMQEMAIDAGPDPFTAEIHVEQVALIVKSHKMAHGAPRPIQVRIEDGRLTVSSPVIDTVHPTGSETYPDWQRIRSSVLDQSAVSAAAIGFTPQLLTRLGKLRIFGKSPAGFTFTFAGERKNLVMHVEDGPTVITASRKAGA